MKTQDLIAQNRVGQFFVAQLFCDLESPVFKLIMDDVLICGAIVQDSGINKAEYGILYTGYSKHFRPIKSGAIPVYGFICHSDEKGGFTIEAEELNGVHYT